jgi:phosphonoacetaldehyde hydrolase
MKNPPLVVFDWAGTLIDHGCRAPLIAFLEAFHQAGIPLDEATARRPMGTNKRDHIHEILTYPEVRESVLRARNIPPDEALVNQLYGSFSKHLLTTLPQHAAPIQGAAECLKWLASQGIPVASTTGYTRSMMQAILPLAHLSGITPRFVVCADEVPAGRPAPWACFRIAETLGIFPLHRAIKIGDTPADIAEGLNANMISLGVSLSGNEIGLSEDQLNALPTTQRNSLNIQAKRNLCDAGAHEVLNTVADLPSWIEAHR